MIAVVSHDAGGAEILSSYVRRAGLNCLYVLEGPAHKIFQRKLGSIKSHSLTEAINQSDAILCGTSWQSNIEIDAIEYARSINKHSTSFLDHWVDYQDRFIRFNKIFLPDEIVVGDTDAEIIAKRSFQDIPIKLIDNPYEQDIRQELSALQTYRSFNQNSISILYICQPMSEHTLMRSGHPISRGYTEKDALRYFLSNSSSLGRPIGRILIRPHPSELEGKYSWTQHEFKLPIEIGGVKTLIEEIAESDIVVGCESMAMVIALLADKRVISCIPPGGRPCRLPHRKITSLQSILQ